MKRSVKYLLFIAAGILFTVGLIFIYTVHKNPWGDPRVYFNAKAIEKIQTEDFKLSSKATNPYYYIEGFQDLTIFIAFSDTRENLDRMVTEKTGKHLDELPPWKDQINKDISYGPGEHNKKYLTPLFDLNQVTNALFFKKEKNNKGWYLVYDRNNTRVYYHRWKY